MLEYGLIGKSLSHSFSKHFFENLFLKENIEASFENIEISQIEEVEKLFQRNFSGLCVTIPYKEKIIPYLDEITDEANQIGAVNVIAFISNKKIGFNTDAFGFQQSIKPFLTNKHERAIILGTGGASKAVAYVLKNLGIEVIFISRNPKFNNQFSYAQMNENMLKACKLVVNCTPVGTFPNVADKIDFPYHTLGEDHLAVDLIYNPVKTIFLSEAENAGATILNGESMLRHQAIKAWEIWGRS